MCVYQIPHPIVHQLWMKTYASNQQKSALLVSTTTGYYYNICVKSWVYVQPNKAISISIPYKLIMLWTPLFRFHFFKAKVPLIIKSKKIHIVNEYYHYKKCIKKWVYAKSNNTIFMFIPYVLAILWPRSFYCTLPGQ